MDTATLVSKLKGFLQGDVVFDDQTLNHYSHDASIFELKPKVVVFPKNISDIEKLISFVSVNKDSDPTLSLTARSGGTDMSGGSINDSIILDFTKYINHIISIENQTAVTEPGVFYRDFEKATLECGWYLPSFPASKAIAALGGMVANNSGGEKTLSHGQTKKYVRKVKMILSDGKIYEFGRLDMNQLKEKMSQQDFEGEIYRNVFKIVSDNYDLIKNAEPKVSKNATGYNLWDVYDRDSFDLSKLFVGAQGTLGLNVETTLELIKYQKHSGLLVIYLDEMSILPNLIVDVLAANPESFEAFDDHTLGLAIKFMPQFIQILGVVGTINMGLQFTPDLVNFAFSGLPKFTLLVEFVNNDPVEIVEKIEQLKSVLTRYPIKMVMAESDQEAESYRTIRRESFNLLRKNVKNRHTAPFIDDLIVQPQYLIEFFPKLIAILEKYKIDYTIAGHMGDGNFHIIPLMDFSDKTEVEKISVVEDEVYKLIFAYHGSMSAEHNEGLVRGYYTRRMYGDQVFNLFREVKKIFDPKNIFNPHKKTDASFEFSMSHVRSHF